MVRLLVPLVVSSAADPFFPRSNRAYVKCGSPFSGMRLIRPVAARSRGEASTSSSVSFPGASAFRNTRSSGLVCRGGAVDFPQRGEWRAIQRYSLSFAHLLRTFQYGFNAGEVGLVFYSVVSVAWLLRGRKPMSLTRPPSAESHPSSASVPTSTKNGSIEPTSPGAAPKHDFTRPSSADSFSPQALSSSRSARDEGTGWDPLSA